MEVCILAPIVIWVLLHMAMGNGNMSLRGALLILGIDIALFSLIFLLISFDNKNPSETPVVVKEETDSADSSPEQCIKDLDVSLASPETQNSNAKDDNATERNSTNVNNYERIIDLFDQLTPDDQTKLLEALQKRIQKPAETSP